MVVQIMLHLKRRPGKNLYKIKQKDTPILLYQVFSLSLIHTHTFTHPHHVLQYRVLNAVFLSQSIFLLKFMNIYFSECPSACFVFVQVVKKCSQLRCYRSSNAFRSYYLVIAHPHHNFSSLLLQIMHQHCNSDSIIQLFLCNLIIFLFISILFDTKWKKITISQHHSTL